jgi:hypothetical protein
MTMAPGPQWTVWGVSEEKIVEVVNQALPDAGIEDTVTAAGEFEPRGHSGAGFAGGLIGGDAGDAAGSLAGGIGAAGGYLFAGNRAHPQALVFRVPREGLEVKVQAPT